jgi:hypothetical protein
MRKLSESSGFLPPPDRALGHESRTVALAQLLAIAALVISTVVVATVVSVGIAHANVIGGVIDNEGTLFAIALLLGLLFIGIGGFSILPPGGRSRRH